MMMKRILNPRASGFTLIEMVVSILLLSIVSTGIMLLYSGLSYKDSETLNAQEGTMLVQACAENITGMRKIVPTFFATSLTTLNASCQYLPTMHNSGSGTTLVVSASRPTTSTPPCPNSPVSCLQFTIYAQNGTWKSQNTQLFFIQY